jgi:hypothetical protein
MVKNLIRAFLICRLELRQPLLDLDLALGRQRPVIQFVLEQAETPRARRAALCHRLDEVYPF